MNEDQREVLLRAARVIDEKGWVQGMLGTSEGVCMIGAISVALDAPCVSAYQVVDNFIEVNSERFWENFPFPYDRSGLTATDLLFRWNDGLPAWREDRMMMSRERVQEALRRLADDASFMEAIGEVEVEADDQTGGEEAVTASDPVAVAV